MASVLLAAKMPSVLEDPVFSGVEDCPEDGEGVGSHMIFITASKRWQPGLKAGVAS
jgi:hypothetical protein